MSRQWSISRARMMAFLTAATMFMLAAPIARADLSVTVNPSSLTYTDTFDLRTFELFGDTGYARLDQSISISGNQIEVDVLIQDLHTNPDWVFADVVTPYGAFFDDFGPLPAAIYEVTAEMWLTFWPNTGPGLLYDTGTLSFRVVPEPSAAALLLAGAAILGGTVLRRQLGQLAA